MDTIWITYKNWLNIWITNGYLVGGLEHLDYFSIYWEESSQLTNSYFSEG